MPSRSFHRSNFNQGKPPKGKPMQLLCEDDRGEYLLPFQYEWRDGAWYGIGKLRPIGSESHWLAHLA